MSLVVEVAASTASNQIAITIPSSCLGPPTHNLRRDALWQSFIFFFRDEEGGTPPLVLLLARIVRTSLGIVVGIERM